MYVFSFENKITGHTVAAGTEHSETNFDSMTFFNTKPLHPNSHYLLNYTLKQFTSKISIVILFKLMYQMVDPGNLGILFRVNISTGEKYSQHN